MNLHSLKLFCLVLILWHFPLFSLTDLEERAQDFVLETKKIEIPGYPHAFNPSIIQWKDGILMSFREIPFPHLTLDSWIGLIWLDKDFNPIGKPYWLNIEIDSIGSEDARLVLIGDQLYIVYSGQMKHDPVIQGGSSLGGFRVYIAQLEFENGQFSIKQMECLSKFEGAKKNRREKNWVPFDYQGHLLLAYSLNPHRILSPLIGTGICETFAVSKGIFKWQWGELRGGTPALLDGNQYLAFFHSCMEAATLHSDGKKVLHYFMGAYTFYPDPPFNIIAISPEPIIGEKFYKGPIYQPYWKPVRVVFPCGFIFDQQHVWISYGRQDHEIWIVKLDKHKLLDSLCPVLKIHQ